MRKAIALAAVAVTAPVAVAVAAQTRPYPVVAHLGVVPIQAPSKGQAWGACPGDALRLDRAEMAQR